MGASPLLYGTWSIICSASCTCRPSFTNNCCGPPYLPSRSRWTCSHRSPDHQRCTWQLLPREDCLPPLHCQLQPTSSLHLETGSWDTFPQSGQWCWHLWTPLHTGEKNPTTSTSLCWASCWCRALCSGWHFFPCVDYDAGERVVATARSTVSERAGRPYFVCGFPGDKRSRAAGGSVTA